MCYDTEKTQAPNDPRVPDFVRSEMRAKQEAHERFLRTSGIMGTGDAGCAMSPKQILEELFSYHPPNPETLPKYAAINQAAKNFAEIILQNCPSSADRSAAIRLIRDARMTANAAIALNGLSL